MSLLAVRKICWKNNLYSLSHLLFSPPPSLIRFLTPTCSWNSFQDYQWPPVTRSSGQLSMLSTSKLLALDPLSYPVLLTCFLHVSSLSASLGGGPSQLPLLELLPGRHTRVLDGLVPALLLYWHISSKAKFHIIANDSHFHKYTELQTQMSHRYLKYNTQKKLTCPEFPASVWAFPISFISENHSSVHPVAQHKSSGIMRNSPIFYHISLPVHQKILSIPSKHICNPIISHYVQFHHSVPKHFH